MAKGVKTGGRVAGTPNKATAEIKALARNYAAEAIEALVNVIRSTDSDAARVAAIREMLDRGYGKATQMLASDEQAGGLKVTIETGVPRDKD